MSDDQKKPQGVDDLRSRLGLGSSSAPPQGSPDVPPPALGGSGVPAPLIAPPGGGSSDVPPPAVGSSGPMAVPPPAVGGGVPAPVFGAKPQLDVAPPPFLAKKKKKKIRKIIQEEWEDVDAVEDPAARAKVRRMAIVCLFISLPVIAGTFYFGKSRQGWALTGRSRGDATELTEKLTKATSVLQEVQTKAGSALSKGQAHEVDESFVAYARDVSERRPVGSGDLDMVNYAAFEPEIVDGLFGLTRTLDQLWGKMATHRNLTKTDLAALQGASKMGTPHEQIRLGVVLMNLDAETYGASVGILGNPAVNDEGAATLDVQVRPGRRSHAMKTWTKGPFGDTARDWVIPVDPRQTAEGEPLSKAERGH